MRFFIEQVGLCGPGLASWGTAQNILTGREPYSGGETIIPALSLLPSNERRRAPRLVKLALAGLTDALLPRAAHPCDYASVFASSGGDGEAVHAIMETLAGATPELSPTRFHHSVHNVAAGYWSIATGSRKATTSLCAQNGSFVAGLMEAGCQATSTSEKVVLVAYDLPYPTPLNEVRPIGGTFAVCFLLSPHASDETIARIDFSLASAAPSLCRHAALEKHRRSIPAARALPLLECLARKEKKTLTLAYRDDCSAILDVTPVS